MRKIKYTEEDYQAMYEAIKQKVEANTVDSSVKIDLPGADQKACLNFTGLAWLKMRQLVCNCSIEIAWHGLMTVNEDRTIFTVRDILVYPQKITAATVDIDEKQYETWHQALNNADYNSIKMQGHSHVNFSTNPSGRDTSTYAELMQYVKPDSFYVFLINNKENKLWCRIIDRGGNAIYETKDIVVTIDGVDLEGWYKQVYAMQISTVSTITPTYCATRAPSAAIPSYTRREHWDWQSTLRGFDETPPDPTDPTDPAYDPFYAAGCQEEYEKDKEKRRHEQGKNKNKGKGGK